MVYYSQDNKNTNERVKNPNYTDYRCGVYAITYWEWKDAEEQGSPYNIPDYEADNYIQTIYSRVRFTMDEINIMKILPDFKGLLIDWNEVSNYSAPATMCEDLNLSRIRRERGTKANIYTSEDSIFQKLGSIGNITKINKIDDLKAGEKAILLMGNNNGIPQHYIFAYGSNQLDAEGHVIMYIIDPADGVDVSTYGNIRNWKGTTSCDFLNTIIKFGH